MRLWWPAATARISAAVRYRAESLLQDSLRELRLGGQRFTARRMLTDYVREYYAPAMSGEW